MPCSHEEFMFMSEGERESTSYLYPYVQVRSTISVSPFLLSPTGVASVLLPLLAPQECGVRHRAPSSVVLRVAVTECPRKGRTAVTRPAPLTAAL